MLAPVIFSKREGPGLWPFSMEAFPKPFLRLANGQSLPQKTHLRVAELGCNEEVLAVAYPELYFSNTNDYREVGAPGSPGGLIPESRGKGTVHIIAAALYELERLVGDGVPAILPAVHVADQVAFAKAEHRADGALSDNTRKILELL